MNYNTDTFKRELEKLGISISEKQLEQFISYYEMLIEKNKVMNLTAITDGVEVLDVLIGDLNAELVGQGGDHINNVKAVCAEIVDNVAVGGNLFRLDLKLIGQIVTDAAENFGIHNLTPL